MDANRQGAGQASRQPKSPQDFAGGLVIMAVAGAALWFGRDLNAGTLGAMGAGMLPKSVAALLGMLGLLLLVSSIVSVGPGLGTWSIRGIAWIGAAIVLFALAVRPLGLVVAAPLAVIVGALASSETRWGETLVFGIAMTAFCVGLFKFALRLPIPLAPWLLGY